MYVKIANMVDLNNFWLDADEILWEVSESERRNIRHTMSELVGALCDAYGENRNPEVVGGNVVILFGNHADIQRASLLEHYNLTEEEYEIRDAMSEPREGYLWICDIYCGTDYNTVLIYRRKV